MIRQDYLLAVDIYYVGQDTMKTKIIFKKNRGNAKNNRLFVDDVGMFVCYLFLISKLLLLLFL